MAKIKPNNNFLLDACCLTLTYDRFPFPQPIEEPNKTGREKERKSASEEDV